MSLWARYDHNFIHFTDGKNHDLESLSSLLKVTQQVTKLMVDQESKPKSVWHQS